MSTLASPQPAFTAIRPRRPNFGPVATSAFKLVLTYVLLGPLIFLCARGSFSFQNTDFNSATGAVANPEFGQGSTLHSAEIVIFYSIILLAMVPVVRRVLATCAENWLLLALPLWAITSTLWSSDPFRSISFSILALIITLLGIYLPLRFTPRQQMQLVLLTGLTATLISIALVVALPSAGIDHKNASTGIQGIYPQKNICAITTALLMLPAFFYEFTGASRSIKRIGYIALLFALIVGTTSRTGFIVLALVAGFALLLKGLHRLRSLERVLVTAFLPAAAVVAGVFIYANRSPILQFLGKGATLSGRTGIWSVVFYSIVQRPLTGFGYNAFFSVRNPEAGRLSLLVGDPKLNNAENGVLQTCLDMGLIGVAILGIVLFRSTRNAITCFRSSTPNYAMWYMSILFITLLALVDGDKFMLPGAISWPLFIMADIGLAIEAKRVRSSQTV